MRRLLYVIALVAVLGALPAAARRHNNDPAPTPSPTPGAAPSVVETKAPPLLMDAAILSSVEGRDSDGNASRDVIVVVEGLANNSTGLVTLSYKSFYIRDPRNGKLFMANGCNTKDFTQETSIAASDGEIPAFKLYFQIPGDLRPDKIYIKINDALITYALGM